MGIGNCLKTGAVVCAMTLAPAVMRAASLPACATEGTTDQAGATHLLNDMRYDARQVAYHARRVETFAEDPFLNARASGIELQNIRWEINAMGKRLCELQNMETTLAPSEQQAVERMTPTLQSMASNADAAINYLNAHEGGLWASSFRRDAKNLDTEAHTVSRRIHRSEQIAEAQS